jgi:hypothetical protein
MRKARGILLNALLNISFAGSSTATRFEDFAVQQHPCMGGMLCIGEKPDIDAPGNRAAYVGMCQARWRLGPPRIYIPASVAVSLPGQTCDYER